MGTLWFSLLALMQPSVVLAFPLRPAGQPSDADLEFAEGYLENFYGLKPNLGRQRRTAESGVFQAKVREMQRFLGLTESGELTAQTMSAMRRARCGLSDVQQFGETVRWKNRTLTYRISSYSPKMRPAHIRRAFRGAWKLWAEVSPITFRRRTRREADIVISFNNKDHADGSPFDGQGGVLAHAFFPGPGIGGDVHFDAEEEWTTNGTGFNLFAVAVHEFGHALGLPHSPDPGAVMYPAYNFVKQTDFILSFQDVEDVQEMYGAHQNFSYMTLKRPPPKTPNKCDPELSFNAVTGMQQELVFFKDRFLWRVHPNFDEIGISLITSLWLDVPSYIDAAYDNVEMQSMRFFKGSQYWETRALELQDGFPKNISDFGFPPRVKAIDAALHFRAARLTVFFTGRECWRYNEEERRMVEGYPKLIAREWPGIRPPIDAAVAYEGFVYFFVGNVQIEYDPKLRYVANTMNANKWLQC